MKYEKNVWAAFAKLLEIYSVQIFLFYKDIHINVQYISNIGLWMVWGIILRKLFFRGRVYSNYLTKYPEI